MNSESKVIGWKCNATGKQFAITDYKKCLFCRPVYDIEELKNLLAVYPPRYH